MATTTMPAVQPKTRLAFIDNLRWVMIVLVVNMHAAVTYSHNGGWYFMEDPKPALPMRLAFATYQTWLQAFFMGLLFLLAGYFVPGAFDRKGFRGFLRDRAVRLGVPSLLYMLVISPLLIFWILHDYYHIGARFLVACKGYFATGGFVGGSGPLWFAVALLIFSLVYGSIRLLAKRPARSNPDAPLPAHLHVVVLWLAMGTCTFLVRIVQPMGANILNMQLCFFSDYVLLFAVGVLAWRKNWLSRLPYAFGMRWLKMALLFGALGWAALIVALLKTHTTDLVSGGFTWQSAAMSFWEAFFCLGVCLGLIVFFRDRFNRSSALTQWLSDNSFSVYVFHAPLLVLVTLALRPLSAPKPLKFLLATVLGVTVTYVASSLVFRRIPGLRRVL